MCGTVADIACDRLPHADGVHCVYMPSEVIDNAANAAFAESVGDDLPAAGGRKVDIWSTCFQGGTFDRVKEQLHRIAVRCRPSISLCAYHCVSYH